MPSPILPATADASAAAPAPPVHAEVLAPPQTPAHSPRTTGGQKIEARHLTKR